MSWLTKEWDLLDQPENKFILMPQDVEDKEIEFTEETVKSILEECILPELTG
jgi:hypothetical protein